MSRFKFLDSGIEIDIERVPFVVTEMLNAAYQSSYPHKPTLPSREIRDTESGELITVFEPSLDLGFYETELKKPNLDETTRTLLQGDQESVKSYIEAKRKWDSEVGIAQAQASRLLYAKHLKSEIDYTAIQRAQDDVAQFGGNLKEQVLALYARCQVPFDEQYMDKWLYLWCVCAASAFDSGALITWMQSGSAEARQAVRQALFPV